ncbi:MAG: hypothetical protein O3C63_07915 [Cyanobacteria bacterium]|nr:hypothetical protein [Cyanobacteriota bacterium]MDA1020295.1 hypothetical protein [Cyanobacteriota bacterium]
MSSEISTSMDIIQRTKQRPDVDLRQVKSNKSNPDSITNQGRIPSRLISMPVNSPAPEAPPVPTKTPAPAQPKPETPPARTIPAPTRRESDPDTSPGAVPCPPSECPHPR